MGERYGVPAIPCYLMQNTSWHLYYSEETVAERGKWPTLHREARAGISKACAVKCLYICVLM